MYFHFPPRVNSFNLFCVMYHFYSNIFLIIKNTSVSIISLLVVAYKVLYTYMTTGWQYKLRYQKSLQGKRCFSKLLEFLDATVFILFIYGKKLTKKNKKNNQTILQMTLNWNVQVWWHTAALWWKYDVMVKINYHVTTLNGDFQVDF